MASVAEPVAAGAAGSRAPTARPLLEVDGVTLQYKTKEHLVTATYRVSFGVFPADRFVLLGPSGCGKSTLLKGVAGFLAPAEGQIRLNGRPVSTPGPDRMMVFQEFDQLLPWKTVRQNITFALVNGGRCAREADADEIAMTYIRKVKLTGFENTYPHMLSGGMKQRVAIARGMAMEPDILLMDEPFSHLDAITARSLRDQLQEIWNRTRKTVVFVTHDVVEAVQLSDRVVIMAHGGVMYADIPITLPYPRKISDPKVAMQQAEILGQFEEMEAQVRAS